VTEAVAIAQSFFCFGLPTLAPLFLDYHLVYAQNKLLNQLNCNSKGGEVSTIPYWGLRLQVLNFSNHD
jgi:hypothetical protein